MPMPSIQHFSCKLTACLVFLIPVIANAHSDTEHLAEAAFSEAPEVVSCQLENGSEAQCYKLTMGHLPEGLQVGPFCPKTLSDKGGLWDWTGDEAGLYRIDRDFLLLLDELGYRFFEDNGSVNSVDNATRPPEYDHACINVTPDKSVQITLLLPVNPTMAKDPTALGTIAKVGVGLDGAPIFADAPSIQERGHMPALDVCGGHIDPGGWYHWHATASDIQTVLDAKGVDADCGVAQDSSALFGYAFDGFPMYGSKESDGSIPVNLDECGGHIAQTLESEKPSYHYHSPESFPNLPGCLVGVQAQNNFSTTASAGVGSSRSGGPGGRRPPDLKEAAQALGVTSDTLKRAIDSAGGPPPDFAAVAKILGVSEAQLLSVMPSPP